MTVFFEYDDYLLLDEVMVRLIIIGVTKLVNRLTNVATQRVQ